MKKYVIGILGVAALCAVLGAYYVWLRNDATLLQQNQNSSAKLSTSSSVGRALPLGWKEYINPFHKFSLLYPEGHALRAVSEPGGAATVVFEDIKNARGFQIFIVPHTEQQTTDERFLLDVSSGIRTRVVELQVDGASGASFNSRDAELGETYEVWFVHNGYMYEVSTLSPLQEYLDEILQTWDFI